MRPLTSRMRRLTTRGEDEDANPSLLIRTSRIGQEGSKDARLGDSLQTIALPPLRRFPPFP